MTQKDAISVFNIVKNDDLSSFCMLLEKDKNLLKISFGRFPLLSVCFLYNSKKIIKKFENQLKLISNFDIEYEPYALYKDFKVKSQKSLRYYANTNDFVMPIEMQAILHKDHFVKRHFKQYAKAKTTEQKLTSIYNINEQKCSIKNQKIKISAKKISKKRLKTIIFANSALFAIAVIVVSILSIIANTIGLGTSFSPRKVYTFAEFVNMVNRNKSVILQNDLDFDESFFVKNYSGSIYGNNKTITINYDYKNYMFDNFSGKLNNITIINNDGEIETEKNLSLFANVNNGKIDNVNIEFASNIKIESTNTETFFCGYAVTNNGYISNCKIDLDIDISSKNNSDCFASGIAGKNYGTISACEVLENSKIKAQNVDISGIVSQNFESAEISSSKNYASLFQKTDMSSWSPNVAGICVTNSGTISNCYNYGNLTAEKMIDTTDNAIILMGGICANNYNLITHSKNDGDIIADNKNSEIYAGGICAYCAQQTQNVAPSIEFCGASGNFDLTKDDDTKFCICGGIAGYMVGNISNSYSLSTFETEYSQEKNNMIALLAGASYGQMFFGLTVNIGFEKAYCLSSEKTEKTLALALTGMGNYYIDDLTNVDITICNSESQIKTSEVYWE